MSKASRTHHGDEFGKSGRNALVGCDGPLIGAASTIALDALVERESGATPPPPPFTIRALVIELVVMFLVGVAALVLLLQYAPPAR